MYRDLSPDYDSSSSCSKASPAGDTPACSQQSSSSHSSASSVDSTQDLCAKTDAPISPFVPTVTAISTSPELQWMVQPTVITSIAPSPGRAKPSKAQGAVQSSSKAGGSKGQSTNRKGQKKQPSSEEDERRKIRRERNKIAAAKCRNRRRELIDTLQDETDQLEDDKAALQTEIADLLKEKEHLEQILASHKPTCKLAEDDNIDSLLQGPPASPQFLSILENGKLPEGNAVAGEGPSLQDLDITPSISTTAILGNSNILLCSSAEEEPMEDLKGDLDDLVPSLEMDVAPETAVAVPDIDLGGPFCLSDWETLYKSMANELEPLSTPIVSSSPNCSSSHSMFSFSCSEILCMVEGCENLKAGLGRPDLLKDSLNSPTLLAL